MSFYGTLKIKSFQFWSVVKDTFLTVKVNPIYLLSLLMVIIWLSALVFVLRVQLEQGVVVSIRFFNVEIANETNIVFVIPRLVLTSIRSLTAIFTFLYIIMASSLFGEFFDDPALPIFLISPIPRSLLLVAKYSGIFLGVAAALITNGILSTVILLIKTHILLFEPIVFTVFLLIQLYLMLCIVLFLELLLRNSFSTTVVSLVIVFLMAPLLEKLANRDIYFSILAYITLKLGIISNTMEKALYHETFSISQYMLATLFGAGYIWGATMMFRKYKL